MLEPSAGARIRKKKTSNGGIYAPKAKHGIVPIIEFVRSGIYKQKEEQKRKDE